MLLLALQVFHKNFSFKFFKMKLLKKFIIFLISFQEKNKSFFVD